jgi:hypothetical protein
MRHFEMYRLHVIAIPYRFPKNYKSLFKVVASHQTAMSTGKPPITLHPIDNIFGVPEGSSEFGKTLYELESENPPVLGRSAVRRYNTRVSKKTAKPSFSAIPKVEQQDGAIGIYRNHLLIFSHLLARSVHGRGVKE